MADPFSQLAIFSAASTVILGGETVGLATFTSILGAYGISIGTTTGTTATTIAGGTVTTATGIALGPMLAVGLGVLGVGLGVGTGLRYLYKRSQSRKEELMAICKHMNIGEEALKEWEAKLVCYLLEKKLISTKIQTEKRKLQNHKFKDEILEGNRIFMVIGECGSGKSTFCNRLLGDKSEDGDEGFCVSHNDRGRRKLSKKTFKNNTGCFTIVDTPGCNYEDGEGKDNEYMNHIIEYLNGCGGINAFLLVVSLAETRVKGSLIQLWRDYQERFGKEFWKYSILILTNLDSVNKRKHILRKQNFFDQLKKKFDITDEKCIMIGHDNYQEAIKELLTVYSKEKFITNNLKSPLHDLEEEEKELSKKISDAKKLIAGYTNELKKLNKRKKELL